MEITGISRILIMYRIWIGRGERRRITLSGIMVRIWMRSHRRRRRKGNKMGSSIVILITLE